MILKLIAMLAVFATAAHAKVTIKVNDPSTLLSGDNKRINGFVGETRINRAEQQLRNIILESELFNTSKCAKCLPGEEFEKDDSGDVISCNCVNSDFFHGDMKLAETTRPIVSALFGGLTRGFTGEERLYWPKSGTGTVDVPYTIQQNFLHREVLQKAFDEYKAKTCIRFVERTNQRDYISIGSLDGCWAYVGKTGDRQELSLGARCGHLGIAEHELMHVLGFFHEQSRPDRDQYVDIRFENVVNGFENNFQKMTNINSGNSAYDIGSVMHYGEYAFSKNGQKTIVVRYNPENKQVGQRDGFSERDIEQINAQYCEGTVSTTASTTTKETTTAATTTPAPTTTPKPTEGECRNVASDVNCQYWVGLGYCGHSFVSFMETYCKKECKLCQELKCGKPKVAIDDENVMQIVGGQEAIAGSIPWQASLRLGDVAWCGGSWIGGEWILTAAHCIHNNLLKYYTVYLGLHFTNPENGQNSNHVLYNVEELVVHERYNRQTLENDIALIKLTKSVEATDFIVPVCLPESSYNIADGAEVTVSGWGDTKEQATVETEALMTVDVQVINKAQCQNWIQLPLVNGTICAGYEEGKKDSCQGDSGGPLTQRISGRRTQVGIVSWGTGCARRQKPGVYSEVSHFRNWIRTNSEI